MARLEAELRSRPESSPIALLAVAALRSLQEAAETIEPDAPDGQIHEPEIRALPEVRAILESPDEIRRECILCLADVASKMLVAPTRDSFDCVQLLSVIARKRTLLTGADIEMLLATPSLGVAHARTWLHDVKICTLHNEKIRALIPQIESVYPGLDDEAKARIRPVLERAIADAGQAHTATAIRLRTLISAVDEMPYQLVDDDDQVGPRLRAVLGASAEPGEARAALLRLLGAFPAKGQPAKKWFTDAEGVRAWLTQPSVLVGALLDAALDAPDSAKVYRYAVPPSGLSTFTTPRYVTPANESFLCGVATFAGVVADPGLVPQLRRLAVKSAAIIGSGVYSYPRSVRLAIASVRAMADAGVSASVSELLVLQRSTRDGNLLREARKGLDALAAACGITRDELLERAVEDHGLGRDGTRRVRLSRGSAVIEIQGQSAMLAFTGHNGVRRKSVPADVKKADAVTLAALRADLNAIRKTIAGERARLDDLLSRDRRWPAADWRSVYLDHPITGQFTRALIWGFRARDGTDLIGIPRNATTVMTSAGNCAEIPADAEARLWHPVQEAPEDVQAWRHYLLEQLITQPVKQAFREVYLLTPAEEQTRIYSNRFAGHIFRQIQARALMKGRGWKPVPVGWWDDGIDYGVARRVYEPSGIRAEFFFDPIRDMHPDSGNLYPYCTSDQVRFFDAGSSNPMDLADVPPLVFTEAMRDVDLFVGVTSIGADPQWLDLGEGRRFGNYWHTYSFGELTAAAEVRREVLSQLLPRLAIAGRCELEERYLVARGDLRTYRIHLGSGNILMSPNNQYLCIVAARDSRAEKLFLPFDDDLVLSGILSKAFLLANDSSITDKTITAQIQRR